MSTGKKVLNVFGIIFAWILSIVLVLLLFVSPMVLSAMSTATPKNLVKTVQRMELPQLLEVMGEDLLGEENEQLAAFLSTNTVKELLDVYMTGFLSIFDSDLPQEGLTEETLKDIVHRNIDELYTLCLTETPDLALLPEDEAKQQLETALISSLQEMTAQLPSGQELLQSLTEDPTVSTALDVMSAVDTIKLSFVLVIVVLSGLIFVCRLFGFRGFRWLSVDLFVGAGLSGLVCAGLAMSGAAITALAGDSPIAEFLVGELLSGFSTGVYIRTGIMLVAAVALLVAYILIKKARANKAIPAPVEQPTEPVQEA